MKLQIGDVVRVKGTDLVGRMGCGLTDGRHIVYTEGNDPNEWHHIDNLEFVHRVTLDNMTLEQFEYALERFDWYYEMSDDHRVWSAGNKRWRELVYVSNRGANYKEVFDKYCEVMRGKS